MLGGGGGGVDEEASSSVMGGPTAGALGSNPYADDEIDPSFLQRSISAPPATDHALSQGADRLSLDYYYYYYQPNNLNPRLPNKAVPTAPGLGAAAGGSGGAPKAAWSTQDDSVLSTHFPQPSKPITFSSSLVDDYVASLDAASSSSPPSGQQGGGGGPSSQPQAQAPLHAPLPGPAPMDVLPLRPSPIGTRLPTTEDNKNAAAKSLMELIQEDFPRTPSPVYHSTPNPSNVAQAISLGMATANGMAGGASQATAGKLASPARPNTAYGPPPPTGGSSASSQQAQAQPGPAPARATGGPGASLPTRSAHHHKSHSAGNLLAASMQGLSLATPADDHMLGHPGPSVVPDLGLGAAMAHHRGGGHGGHGGHPADHLDAQLAAARQQQAQRVMYQHHHHHAQALHDHAPQQQHPGASVGGPPPGVEFAPQGSGGYLLAGGAAPMYATAEQPQPVYFRVAPPQAGGPYRQDLMYARVPAEYVTATGAEMRLHPEYVSVIPMPSASSAGAGGGGGQGGGYNLSWGAHGQRLVAAPPPPPPQFGGRDVAGVGPQGAARLAFPYHAPHHHAAATDVFTHGRLQQEAHERGYKLVPKDMPLGPPPGGPRHHDLDGRDKRSGGGRHLRERERASLGGVTSSSTLDEFRNNTKNRPWDIRDISGDIVEFCQDQHGSRFIQQKLEMASDEEKELIFKEVLPRAHTLMTDVFGNYVIQKVLEHGTTEQRDVIASILTGHAVQLALQMYGCRVVQKALEVIGVQRLLSLVAEFEGHVLKCVHDQNGNHVIQKCIEVLSLKTKESPEYASFLLPQVDFIVQAFVGQVEKFSTHPYGCRVIQRILEHCTGTQKNVILDEIRKCTGTLIQDQYGNYVIQHVMKHGRPQDRQMVINEVKSRMLLYSQHKFASNVVEKCLQYGSKAERNDIIEEVVRSVLEKSSLLQVMVRDPYGNYVVQKILDIADDRQQEALCSYLKHHAAQLKRYTYGKHILVRLEKISGEKML